MPFPQPGGLGLGLGLSPRSKGTLGDVDGIVPGSWFEESEHVVHGAVRVVDLKSNWFESNRMDNQQINNQQPTEDDVTSTRISREETSVVAVSIDNKKQRREISKGEKLQSISMHCIILITSTIILCNNSIKQGSRFQLSCQQKIAKEISAFLFLLLFLSCLSLLPLVRLFDASFFLSPELALSFRSFVRSPSLHNLTTRDSTGKYSTAQYSIEHYSAVVRYSKDVTIR